LLIVGDTFGFWELTLVQGVEKSDHIITAHQAIFDQLRATGARIKITMMVGNHDYDLGCNRFVTGSCISRKHSYSADVQEMNPKYPLQDAKMGPSYCMILRQCNPPSTGLLEELGPHRFHPPLRNRIRWGS
jgi:hypothetical protein